MKRIVVKSWFVSNPNRPECDVGNDLTHLETNIDLLQVISARINKISTVFCEVSHKKSFKFFHTRAVGRALCIDKQI